MWQLAEQKKIINSSTVRIRKKRMKKQYIFTDTEYNLIKSNIEQCHITAYKQLKKYEDNPDVDINLDIIHLCNDLQLVLDVLNGYLELEDNE